VPTVDVTGAGMAAIVAAIPEVESRTGRPVIVVGGLAVICRLGSAHRATTDLDTVNRRRGEGLTTLELLVNSPDAEASGPAGVLAPTPQGAVQVDVREVSDADLNPLPQDPTDRLHVLAHDWAAQTASPLRLRTDAYEVEVAVAEPGPLVAMKLQALMKRPSDKEATDLLDIVRLTLDPATGPRVRQRLGSATAQIRIDCLAPR